MSSDVLPYVHNLFTCKCKAGNKLCFVIKQMNRGKHDKLLCESQCCRERGGGWHFDGNVPLWGMDGECQLHLFSLAVHRPYSCLLSCNSYECINIYPRDVCPCSATAKPLSRKVNSTSFPHNPPAHSSHISHLSYTFHAIHQPPCGGLPDYPQQLSRVLNGTAGWWGWGLGRQQH